MFRMYLKDTLSLTKCTTKPNYQKGNLSPSHKINRFYIIECRPNRNGLDFKGQNFFCECRSLSVTEASRLLGTS